MQKDPDEFVLGGKKCTYASAANFEPFFSGAVMRVAGCSISWWTFHRRITTRWLVYPKNRHNNAELIASWPYFPVCFDFECLSADAPTKSQWRYVLELMDFYPSMFFR